jgi:hypothetical protein
MTHDNAGADPSSPDREKGKGKGKESDSPPNVPRETSAISRIAESAVQLGGSLIPRRPAASDLSCAISAEKGTAASRNPHQSSAIEGESSTTGPPVSGESFRSNDTGRHIRQHEREFSNFLNGTDILTPAPLTDIRQDSTPKVANSSTYQPRYGHLRSDITAQEMQDGAAVSTLLHSEPAEDQFTLDEEMLPEPEMQRLRQTLFGGGEYSAEFWAQILDFTPESLQKDISESAGLDGSRPISEDAVSLTGLSQMEEARNQWASHWDGVLSRYNEEVWGELTPLVQAAKESLRTIMQTGTGEQGADMKAVARLRQLLAHIRAV